MNGNGGRRFSFHLLARCAHTQKMLVLHLLTVSVKNDTLLALQCMFSFSLFFFFFFGFSYVRYPLVCSGEERRMNLYSDFMNESKGGGFCTSFYFFNGMGGDGKSISFA
jgi:hypothetical protein